MKYLQAVTIFLFSVAVTVATIRIFGKQHAAYRIEQYIYHNGSTHSSEGHMYHGMIKIGNNTYSGRRLQDSVVFKIVAQ